MDSGNSGSTQSSSGGEDEYDDASKADESPTPLLLNSHGGSHPLLHIGGSMSSTSTAATTTSHNSSLPYHFMNLPSLFDANPYANHHDLNLTHFELDMLRTPPGSGPRPDNQAVPSGGQNMLLSQHGANLLSSPPAASRNEPNSAAAEDRGKPAAGRNPRKRTRASRRAPTTVLTTDTANFRAMVQEFTGFPAPPFSGSRKLDLFGTSVTGGGGSFITAPLYHPLRPSAQKLDANNIVNAAISNIIANTNPSLPNSFMANLAKPPQNSILAFPPLTHHDQPLNTPNMLPGFGNIGVPSPPDKELGNDFDSSWPPDGLPSHTVSDDNPSRPPTDGGAWKDQEGGGSNGAGGREEPRHHHHPQLMRSSFNGNNNYGSSSSQGFNGGCKLSYSSAPAPDLHHHSDKGGMENSNNNNSNNNNTNNSVVSSRSSTGEGRVDYWIGPSD